jgi:hypothetical protein
MATACPNRRLSERESGDWSGIHGTYDTGRCSIPHEAVPCEARRTIEPSEQLCGEGTACAGATERPSVMRDVRPWTFEVKIGERRVDRVAWVIKFVQLAQGRDCRPHREEGERGVIAYLRRRPLFE